MPSLCRAWRWDTVIPAPEAASRPFSPSFESHRSTGPATPLIASQPQVTCPVPQHRPTFHPADCSSRFRDPSHSLASHFLGLQPPTVLSSLPQPLSLGVPWAWPLFLARTQVSASPHPSCRSSALPRARSLAWDSLCAPALTPSSPPPSPAWAPWWSHPPAPGSGPPASLRSPGKALLASTLGLLAPAPPPGSLLFWWPGQPRRVHQVYPLTCWRTQIPSFPPSLRPCLHPPLWLFPIGLQMGVLPTPLPMPLVLQKICLWSPSLVFLPRFSLTCALLRLSPSPLHLAKIIRDLHVAKSCGQLLLMALTAASGAVRGSYVLPVGSVGSDSRGTAAFSLMCLVFARLTV